MKKQDKFTRIYCVSLIFYNWCRFVQGIQNDDKEHPKIEGISVYASKELNDGEAQIVILDNETYVSRIDLRSTRKLIEYVEDCVNDYTGKEILDGLNDNGPRFIV